MATASPRPLVLSPSPHSIARSSHRKTARHSQGTSPASHRAPTCLVSTSIATAIVPYSGRSIAAAGQLHLERSYGGSKRSLAAQKISSRAEAFEAGSGSVGLASRGDEAQLGGAHEIGYDDGAGVSGLANCGNGDGYDGGRETPRRVAELRSRVQARDGVTISLSDIAALYDYPLDRFQQSAVTGFLEGASLVVCAPTSSGKTLIAEAAAAAILARGKRLLYTTPLKALSNQKLHEFQELFGEANVGLLTGDAAVNRKAPIMVMTTEILRNMLYESVGSTGGGGRLMDVDVVVLDEVHYLSDISRGTVWEETIIYCPKNVQLICLSATVANPEELAGWIAQVHGPTKLVTSSTRPVPLQWHFSTRQTLLPLLNEESTAMNPKLSINQSQQDRGSNPFWDFFGEDILKKEQPLPLRTSVGFKGKERRGVTSKESKREDMEKKLSEDQIILLRRKQVPQIKHTLMQLKERDMLPAIWFIFSRKGCDTAVGYIEEVNLLSEDEARQVREALRRFRQQYPESMREMSVKALLRGAAAHHAGCLPTWKSFIEELFQKGLVKVVFSTETLAAGINMPARTAVLSSLSKRGDDGHALLSSNAMLQMAGRAGRRGIDTQGHVVVMQTPFEGAEECCEVLLAGPEPLVSQFTTTYGMVLNLLAGPRVANLKESSGDDRPGRVLRRGRTLDEARALIDQSFGNFVGSDVLASTQGRLASLHEEIERLRAESAPEGFVTSLENQLTKKELREYMTLSKRVTDAKQVIKKAEEQVHILRGETVKQFMKENEGGRSPFFCVEFLDKLTGEERVVPVLYVGSFPYPPVVSDTQICQDTSSEVPDISSAGPYYTGFGSDNCWYMFTGRSVKSVQDNNSVETTAFFGPECIGTVLKEKLQAGPPAWKRAEQSGDSTICTVWSAGSTEDTRVWGGEVPPHHELSRPWEGSPNLAKAEKSLQNQRTDLAKLRKKLKSTQGFREAKLLLDLQQRRSESIVKLQSQASSVAARIKQLQPSGWNEFLQVAGALQSAGALHADANSLLPLGEVAAAVRGMNELWLALAFTSDPILLLKPAQLAAACGTLVSEGMKARAKDTSSAAYTVSRGVSDWVTKMDDVRVWLLRLQARHGVEIPAGVDKKFAGLVEAWASGVSWQELIEDCGMDEGDVARLLRRSLDLLSQIPHLPQIDPALEKSARAARAAMDRPPISELIA